MNVVLTNDDGIAAEGMSAMRRALLELPGAEVVVIAPAANRSATGRSFTVTPLSVEEVELPGGGEGFAVDGTPVDCVRLAFLGAAGFVPDVIVSGINHGPNLGDDIAYSGTVAAAVEATVLGIPAVAVSQQSRLGELDFQSGDEWTADDFEEAARFATRLAERLAGGSLEGAAALNVNCPSGPVRGARICRLGKRVYSGRLELTEESDRRRRYQIYGELGYEQADEIDFLAIREGCISVTPIQLNLTDEEAARRLRDVDLDGMLSYTG